VQEERFQFVGDDAEALIKAKNGDMCARLYRRADGTVLTEDCPVGFSMKVAHVGRRIGWVPPVH